MIVSARGVSSAFSTFGVYSRETLKVIVLGPVLLHATNTSNVNIIVGIVTIAIIDILTHNDVLIIIVISSVAILAQGSVLRIKGQVPLCIPVAGLARANLRPPALPPL